MARIYQYWPIKTLPEVTFGSRLNLLRTLDVPSPNTEVCELLQLVVRMPIRALAQKLDQVTEEMKETKITLEAPTVNRNYSKIIGKNPRWCLVIPNKLFILWNQHKSLGKQLEREISQYTELANESLRTVSVQLSTSARSLETRLETESYRFHAKYKKMGGASRKKLTLKHTCIILLENEIRSSPGAHQVTQTHATTTSTVSNSSPAVHSTSTTTGSPRRPARSEPPASVTNSDSLTSTTCSVPPVVSSNADSSPSINPRGKSRLTLINRCFTSCYQLLLLTQAPAAT